MKVKVLLAGLCCLLLILLGSCKSDDAPTTPGGGGTGLSSTAFPNNSVTIPAGSGTVSGKITGGTPPYSIQTAPNAAVATAVFSNDTLKITPVAPGATSVVIRDASASGNPTSIAINVTTPSTITVNGFVRDNAGEPINGIAVIVKGKPPVTSTANGSFSVPNVTPPYEIAMIVSTQLSAVVYQGLTRSDPTLTYTAGSLGTVKSATISGTVPAAVGKTTSVFFVSGVRVFSTTANQTTGAYTINASWFDATTTFNGQLYVVRFTPVTTGFPTDYDGFGQKPLTISSGGTFSNNNFSSGELTDPAEQTISGSVNRSSSSYTLNSRQLYITFGNAIRFIASQGGAPPFTDNFSITVPSIPGATWGIVASATETPTNRGSFGYKAGVAAGTSGVTIPLFVAPQLSAPVNNGTNVDTLTSFLYSPGGAPSGVHLVNISAGGANPRFSIYTNSGNFNIPNLASVGLGLPAATNYQWNVVQYSPLNSVNDAASSALNLLLTGSGGDLNFGSSEQFTFTTKP